MNVREWKSHLKDIHEAFYDDLVGTADCGAFDGGCLTVARALQSVIGGDIVVLVRPDDTADHAVVLLDDKLWDYDGPLKPARFLERFNRTEMIGVPWRAHGFRPIREGDLPDAYVDDALIERLARLFASTLPEELQMQAEQLAPGPR